MTQGGKNMQYLFHEENNLYGYADRDEEFSFPSKIKQMGCIDDTIKIYMEDYVYTYLYQFARTGGNTEKLAALVGRHMIVDGQEVIVISGAIQGKYTVHEKGGETFGEETWNYVNEQMAVYFQGLSLIGWVHTQPGFGAFLMAKDEVFHKVNFKEKWQVLFVIDPLDKLDTFFAPIQEGSGLRPVKGYFIYYEKNQEMHEYMLENMTVEPKELDCEKEEVEQMEQTEELTRRRGKPTPEERMDAAKDIRRVLQRRAKEAEVQSKTRFKILTGVSCLLCAICVLMGASLVNNFGRIKQVEADLLSVRGQYEMMAQSLEQKKTQMVFGGQSKSNPEEKISNVEKTSKVEKKEEVLKETTEPTISMENIEKYVVEEGDNLGYISMKYYGTKSNVDIIMKVNGLTDSNKIIIGQVLDIPQEEN